MTLKGDVWPKYLNWLKNGMPKVPVIFNLTIFSLFKESSNIQPITDEEKDTVSDTSKISNVVIKFMKYANY